VPNYEYAARPFIASVRSIDGKAAGQASAELEKAINLNATDGWEFYQIGAISIVASPGCLGALTGAKAGSVRMDQLIFRREKKA
jgi:hypothetical protein